MISEMEANALIRVVSLRLAESIDRMKHTKSKAKIAKEISAQQDYRTELVTLGWVKGKK